MRAARTRLRMRKKWHGKLFWNSSQDQIDLHQLRNE